MRTILLMCLAFFLLMPLYGQDNPYGEPVMSKKEIKKLAKEKRIAERKAEEERMAKVVSEIIYSQRFVLEADFLSGRSGSRQTVSSNLNFIILDSLEATLQVGSNFGLGYNGVGGVTIEGEVTKYEISKRETKRGVSYSINMNLSSIAGHYDITLWISSYGNAEATVRGLYSGSLTYSGRIVPISSSKVYKGRSL